MTKLWAKIPTEIKTIVEVFALTLLFIVGANIIIAIFTENGSNTLADVSSVVLTAVIVYITISNNKKTTRLQEDIKESNVLVAYKTQILEIFNLFLRHIYLLHFDTEFLANKDVHYINITKKIYQVQDYLYSLSVSLKQIDVVFKNDEVMRKMLYDKHNVIQMLSLEFINIQNIINDKRTSHMIEYIETRDNISSQINATMSAMDGAFFREELILSAQRQFQNDVYALLESRLWENSKSQIDSFFAYDNYGKHFEPYLSLKNLNEPKI